MWKLCFKLNGKDYCPEIPTLIRRVSLPPDPPELIVVIEVRDPDPQPWIEGFEPVLAKDLQILATLGLVAKQLSPSVGKKVLKTLTDLAKEKLPKDVSLHVDR